MTVARPLLSPKPITTPPPLPLFATCPRPNAFSHFNPRSLRLMVSMAAARSSTHGVSSAPSHSSSSPSQPLIASDSAGDASTTSRAEAIEVVLEKVIYGCRFMAFMAVMGSLIGSLLCYVKGCTYVVKSFMEYFAHRSKVILILIDAIDVYLLGTVMLVFGMGLYELFISNLDKVKEHSEDDAPYTSSLFGMFILKARPKWLDISTVNELKTKVGHVIVMLLLIGLLEKSMLAVIQSPLDLLCFSASVLLSSGCLLLLSKLKE